MGVEGLSGEERSVLAALRAGDPAAADRLVSLDEASRRRVMAALTGPGGSEGSPAAPSDRAHGEPAPVGGAPPLRRVVVAVAVVVLAIAGAGAYVLYDHFTGGDAPGAGDDVGTVTDPARVANAATAPASDSAVGVPAASSGYTAVAAGLWHSCGLRADATVVCWGDNTAGQSDTPEGTFSAIAGGLWHSCGLRADNTITCWGDNQHGQTGAPSGIFTAVAAGNSHTCGLATNNTIVCWGDNTAGQTQPPSGTFTAVAAGDSHTCGLATDNTTTCWGDNEYGQTDAPSGTFTTITAGNAHTCALGTDATVTCWGDNTAGQTQPPPGTFTAITAGDSHTCALATENTTTCWGDNQHGQTDAPPGTFTTITAGNAHTCALATNHTVTCWGDNTRGQIQTPKATDQAQEITGTAPAGVGVGVADNASGPDDAAAPQRAPQTPESTAADQPTTTSRPPQDTSAAVAAGDDPTCELRADDTTNCRDDNIVGLTDVTADSSSLAVSSRRSTYGVSYSEPQPLAFHRDSATDEVLDPPRLEEWRYDDLEFTWQQHGDAAPFLDVVRAWAGGGSGFSIAIHEGRQIDSLIRGLREFVPEDYMRIDVTSVEGATRTVRVSWASLSGDLSTESIFAESGDMTAEITVRYFWQEQVYSDVVDKLAPLFESISLDSAEFPRR